MNNKVKNIIPKFDLYRYQLLPEDRYLQGEFFEEVSSLEELIKQKNAILHTILKNIKSFKDTRGHTILLNLKYDTGPFLLFRVAVSRSITIETQDFNQKEIDNWPSFYIAFWNDPIKQLIYIQRRTDAFHKTEIVTKILETEITKYLNKKQLIIFIRPLFKKEKFWRIVTQFKGKIRNIRFNLLTPNMSNISGGLSEDLKLFAKQTNTSTTTLSMSSDYNSSLHLDENDRNLNGIVNYASNGGGDISFKIFGYENRIHTTDTKRSIKMDNITIQGNDPEKIINILKELTNDEGI